MTDQSSQIVELSEDGYRLLAESVTDYAILLLDLNGHVLTWNLGAERIKGFSAGEIIGRHFSAFYPPEDVAAGKPEEELRVVRAVGRIEDEGWRVRKDGTRFWANIIITALHDEEGRLKGFGKVTRDLTLRRQAEEELRRSEERFRLLVESVGDYAVYMLDPTGHVTTWNTGAENIKGFAASDVIGKHFSLFFTPEDVREGHPARELMIARTEGRFEEEGWRVRKDGSQFWASVVVTAIRDAHGEFVGFAKVTRDLTTRRLADQTARELIREQAARAAAEEGETRLREERERYRALSRRLEVILEGVADGITAQDGSGALKFANTAAAKSCGYSSVEELLHASPAEIVDRFDVLDEHGNAFNPENLPGRLVLRGAETAAAVMRVRKRESGRDTWSFVRSTAVVGPDGETDLAVNIWHDVSEERRREEHERYLARATAALASSLHYESMPSALAGLLVPGLADWCSIHLLEGEELRNVAVAHVDPAKVALAREYQKHYPPDPRSPRGVWNVVHTGRSEFYETISEELLRAGARDAAHLEILRGVGMQSLIIVPICVGNRVSGTISLVAAEGGRRYDRHDVALAEELGRRAGTSIENAKLYAAEKRARGQLELLARAGEALSGTLDYQETLHRVVQIALPLLADFAFFDVAEGGGIRRLAAAHEDPEVDGLIRHAKGIRSARTDTNLYALAPGQTGFHPHIDDAWMQEAADDPEHLDFLRRLRLGSMVTVPLQAGGKVLGSMTVCFGKSGRHHTLDDLNLAEELARRAGIAIFQARLYEETRAAARQAEEASRVKDEFLATVSHELRTPLNAIFGWSSLLRERGTDPSVAKAIEVIHRNAQAQGKIIEDILDVSRIITGKLRLEMGPADLVVIIRDAVEVIRPSATAKQIAVDFEPSFERCLLVADPERLQQVVWNLLSNAVKFGNERGRISIAIEQQQSNLVISVADTGKGIEAEFLPYVFERFKQADGSTTRRVAGLGLGLAIVRHIVELHGGQVQATSGGPGTGAKFTVTLPVRAVAPSKLESERPSSPAGEQTLRQVSASLLGLRVLVVDDEPDARDLLQTVLAGAGGSVATAASASEGFEALQRFRPHVLVSDIGMAGEDGYAFMQRIRALDPAIGGGTPSIALTAYARSEDKTKALAVGFTTHIGKPVNPDDLLAAVANLARLSPRVEGRP